MDWLLLSLICAFSLASADAATKKFLSDYTAQELVLIRFGFTGLVLSPALFIYPIPKLPTAFWGWIAALVPLEILAMWLYMRAIRTSPLAQTLPYLAFTPVFTTVTGLVILGEHVSWRGLVGILSVTAGAYLLNVDRVFAGGKASLLKPFHVITRESGPRLMLGVAFLYSITSVLGKGALQYVAPAFFGMFYFVIVAVAALALFSAKQPSIARVLWRSPARHCLVALAMAVMIITHFLAVQQVEVAYMIAVKRTSLLFGIVYGALLFREQRVAQHLGGGLIMVAGVCLIVLG